MTYDPIKILVTELSRLPGIGERTALRLALYLVQQKKDRALSLARSLTDVAESVQECKNCCNITAYSDLCSVCQKTGRDAHVICIVACIQDLMAIELSQSFRGIYHVLHGVIEPMQGVGPEKLRMEKLFLRLKNNPEISELIIATPASIEGEATALYIREQVLDIKLKITRIASGIPVGGDLQFTDRLSLARALAMRTEIATNLQSP